MRQIERVHVPKHLHPLDFWNSIIREISHLTSIPKNTIPEDRRASRDRATSEFGCFGDRECAGEVPPIPE